MLSYAFLSYVYTLHTSVYYCTLVSSVVHSLDIGAGEYVIGLDCQTFT